MWRSLVRWRGPRVGHGVVAPRQRLEQRRGVGFSSLSPRSLREICKLELFESEGRDACAEIWRAYHEEKRDAAGAVLTRDVCARVLERAKQCPMFVFPVFKSTDGAFLMMLSQFQQNVFLFTSLEEYKQNPHGATPWLSIALYDDLTATKDLGLLRADFMPSVSKKEAQVLAEMLVDAYDVSFADHCQRFNLTPQSFSFDLYSKSAADKFSSKFTK